jgi:hypothetical protein
VSSPAAISGARYRMWLEEAAPDALTAANIHGATAAVDTAGAWHRPLTVSARR